MAKKQAKKSKGAKKEKTNVMFDSASFGVIEAVKSQCTVSKPVFSNYQKLHDVSQSPMDLVGVTIVTPWFDRLMETLDDMATLNYTFKLNDDKIIHNNTVYDTRMKCKIKMPANQYIFQLWENTRMSNCNHRFKLVTDAVFDKLRSITDSDDAAFQVTSLLMNTFHTHIVSKSYRAISSTLYGVLYSGQLNPMSVAKVSEVWGGYKKLDEWILNDYAFRDMFSKLKGSSSIDGFDEAIEYLSGLIADKWLETAPDNEEYQKVVTEFNLPVNWEEIDLLKILPDISSNMKEFYRYKMKHPKYSAMCPEIEIPRPMTLDTDYRDLETTTMFGLPLQAFIISDVNVSVDESIYQLSWDAMIQKTLKNTKSDMSIRFVSEKYKKHDIFTDGTGIRDVVRNWTIPGLIKAIFPNRIFVNAINAVLVADHFAFEVIYKGNADRLNDYAFNSNNEMIDELTPELYDEIYDYIRSEGNVLVLRHRGVTMFLDENVKFFALKFLFKCDNVMYSLFEVRKITQCIIDAYSYLKSKETDGSIDFYFEENEIVTHQSTKRHQIIQRRGSFVRGHYRHYKSGVVTLVRPHVRKGTNYIGEYVLEL